MKHEKSKLGIITIGQSPRSDLTGDLENILGDDVTIIEKGVLDDYSFYEAVNRFSPDAGEVVLVSRMRDGRQVTLGEEKIISGIQTCINEMERTCDMVLLLCTGKFPEFQHQKPLIVPQGIVHATISRLNLGEKIGAIVPDTEQVDRIRKWWSEVGIELEIEVASPYGDTAQIEAAAAKFKNRPVSCIVLDCMGYSHAMKTMVMRTSGKMVMLPRTMIARLIKEMVGR